MTTYIKKIITVPVKSLEEFEEAIKDEVDYIQGVAELIEDITSDVDGKDDEAIMFKEIKELKRMSNRLEDVYTNLTELLEGYKKMLSPYEKI